MTPQEKAKQQAEVMMAFADGRDIESSHSSTGEWSCTKKPTWRFDRYDYRIKPQEPTVKNLEAWIDTGDELRRFIRGKQPHVPGWTRVPSLDLEYTVTE